MSQLSLLIPDRPPVFRNRIDTYLAKDRIRPYGEYYARSSETMRKYVQKRLAGIDDLEEE